MNFHPATIAALHHEAREALKRPLVAAIDSAGNPYRAVRFVFYGHEFYVDSLLASEQMVFEEMALALEMLEEQAACVQ